MGNKQRIFTLMAILTAVTFISFGVSNYILYRRAIRMQRDRLIDVVQNQAQWFEQLLRFNLQSGGANQANVLRSTKAHIQELQFRGLGRTGEILFADREGDSIVFLSNRRFVKTGQSLSLSLSIRSSLSQPMRLALSGQSGTVIGPDYRGAKVLAAYEYIPLFGIGVVAKMDFSEIRAPFVDSTVVSGLLASLAIAIGLLLFYRVSNPMVTAVEQSEKKYRSLMDSLQEGVWAIDKNVDTTFVNPRMAGMLGYSIDEMLGKPLFEFMDEEGARAAKAKLKRRQQGVSEQHDFTFLKKDGSRIYTTLATSPLLDEQGRYAGALAGVMDLTERRRMEDALRGSEEKFRSVVEQSSDGIVLTDTNGLIIEWNPAAERILGPKRSDAINRPLWDVQYLLAPESKRTPETKEKLQSMLKAFYRDRKAPWIDRISENEIQMPDGRLRIIQSIVFPIQTGSGFMVGSIIRDVTETKKNESDLKFLLQEKDLLLKEVHHRVKNNFQIVASLLNIQSRSLRDPQAVALFQENRDRIHTMSLIHEKLYQGPSLTHIPFGEILRDLATGLFTSYRIDSRNVAVRVDASPMTLPVDKVIPCGLIVNELVTNCLKYAFPKDQERMGEIDIKLGRTSGGRVRLSVADNGVGLPKDFDMRKTRSFGLHLVNLLVEDQLAGKIKIERKNGTKFTIEFGN